MTVETTFNFQSGNIKNDSDLKILVNGERKLPTVQQYFNAQIIIVRTIFTCNEKRVIQ